MKQCPLCQTILTPLRWRTSELVSGYDLRCPCGNYDTSVTKDGTIKTVTVRTHIVFGDEVPFRDGHVPGPGDSQ